MQLSGCDFACVWGRQHSHHQMGTASDGNMEFNVTRGSIQVEREQGLGSMSGFPRLGGSCFRQHPLPRPGPLPSLE